MRIDVLKKPGAIPLAPLILWCFFPGFRELWHIYSSFWLFENAVAAGVILVVYGIAIWKYGLNNGAAVENRFLGLPISLGIMGTCLALVLNNFLGGFQVITPILAYFALYFWMGFWLKPTFWKQSVFVFFLLVLTLPIVGRLQQFIGFPLRLMTAQVVSFLLQLVGVGNIPKAAVILTENYATTIDLPCSGVKSLYFGGVILLAIYFLQQIRLSIKSILLALIFFAALIFFNIWRVFGLVYVYGVLHLLEFGNSIHVLLGVLGFVASCLLLWFGSEYLKKYQHAKSSTHVAKYDKGYFGLLTALSQKNTTIICATVLVITGILTHTVIKIPDSQLPSLEHSISFSSPNTSSSEIPLSDAEKTIFFDTDVSFATKYELKWKQKSLSLLLVKSSSARSHHDPELCLQGLGYRLLQEQSIQISDKQLKQIEIQTSVDRQAQKGFVYYWFVSSDSIITEYSERVWEQFRQPNKDWVLVEVIASEQQELTSEELEELFDELTTAVRTTVL